MVPTLAHSAHHLAPHDAGGGLEVDEIAAVARDAVGAALEPDPGVLVFPEDRPFDQAIEGAGLDDWVIAESDRHVLETDYVGLGKDCSPLGLARGVPFFADMAGVVPSLEH